MAPTKPWKEGAFTVTLRLACQNGRGVMCQHSDLTVCHCVVSADSRWKSGAYERNHCCHERGGASLLAANLHREGRQPREMSSGSLC